MSRIPYGETPKTKFLDEIDAVEVQLLDFPSLDRIKKVLVDVVYGFEETGTYDKLSEEDREKYIQDLLKEGALPKGMEMMNFTILIKNISLTTTHMWVRHRFFSIIQRSTATNCLRKESFVMPRSFGRNKEFYEEIKQWYLAGKALYCKAVDEMGCSVQDARVLIPKNNCNHMYIHTNLLALKDALGKRMDTAEETIVNNIICKKIINLLVDKFPILNGFFKADCETGRCLHSKPGKFSNVCFKRDELHQKFLPTDYLINNPDNLLHDFTRDEMNKGDPIKTETYQGKSKQIFGS
jgi:thymidylate synthase ThyX